MVNAHVPPPVEYQPPSATLTPSLVRTLLPFLVGLVGTWLTDKLGADVDDATVSALLTAGIGYGYYVVVRFLEVFGSDRWGYILGFRRLPVYAPQRPSTVVAGDADPYRGEEGRIDLASAGIGIAIVGLVGLVASLLADSANGVAWFTVTCGVGVIVALIAEHNRHR